MLKVSIDYKDTVMHNVKAEFNTRKKVEWMSDPEVQLWLYAIDKAEVVDGFVLRDRWGKIVPPDYMSSGFKALTLMKYVHEYPVYATRCGDNCVPFIEALATKMDIHVVLHHCMPFSEGFQFYVTDVDKIVTSFKEWVNVYYDVERTMR